MQRGATVIADKPVFTVVLAQASSRVTVHDSAKGSVTLKESL